VSPLKIAVVVEQFPALSETFILRQVTGLVDAGHEVDIFSNRRPDGHLVHEQVREYRLERRVHYVHTARTARSALLRDAGLLAQLSARRPDALRLLQREGSAPYGGRRSLLRRLRVLLPRDRYDVVHCHFGNIGLAYRFAAAYWRVPLVVSFHGFDFSRDPQRYGPRLYDPLFPVADAVTVNSEYARERLEELGCPPSALRILHYGVQRPAVPPRTHRARGTADDPARLLTVARLVEKKGVEYAIRAVATVGATVPGVRYDIIGDGPLRPELEALARSLGVADRIVFRGPQEQRAVQAALAEADLFILPSVTAASGDQEGTPNVLMEASSYGVPVVSTLHSGIPEVVRDGETGFLVPERDVPALADRIAFLAGDPELRTTMGRAGRRYMEQCFDVQVVTAQLEELYREAIARRQARTGATAR
jgi:colanic acid/amylovoran biosynthesis glycosyltransferase